MMTKLPTKHKKKLNGNHLDPDEQLTPKQACAYAAEHDVHLNINVLALLRRDGKGPQYLLINGRWIRYTPRFLDPLIKARKTQVVDPAQRRAAAR